MQTAIEQTAEVRAIGSKASEIIDTSSRELAVEAIARCGGDAALALAQAHALAARIAGIDEETVIAQTRTVCSAIETSEDHGAFVTRVRVLVEVGQ